MFRRKSQPTTQATEFPKGTFLSTEQGFFFVLSPNRRMRFITRRVLDSWAPSRVVEASEKDPAVKRLVISASKMKFRDGSLLYSQANGKMYLVSDKLLRHITNPDWLHHLGLDRSEAVWVSNDEINLHEMGEPLN